METNSIVDTTNELIPSSSSNNSNDNNNDITASEESLSVSLSTATVAISTPPQVPVAVNHPVTPCIASAPVAMISGYISRVGEGVGRNDNDRQFVFCNNRPVDVPKVSKVINEVRRRLGKLDCDCFYCFVIFCYVMLCCICLFLPLIM